MSTIMKMAADIIAAHASTTPMTKEELISELTEVHAALAALERGEIIEPVQSSESAPAVTRKKPSARI